MTVLALVIVVVVLWSQVRSHRRELESQRIASQPCERCGSVGSTSPWSGSPSSPHFYSQARLLCRTCETANSEWLENRLMLETESRFHFGREQLVRTAEAEFGDQAPHMLALLLLARARGIDSARRVLTDDSFQRARPWLEANLRLQGREGRTEQ